MTTREYLLQADIDTDPTDEFAPDPLRCDGQPFGSRANHYYCDPRTCIDAAMNALDYRQAEFVYCTTCRGTCVA